MSINQPCYLGWMGYFDRIAKSDLHIVLDHVQLEKGGFTNRTRIMQPDGRVMWLTIPVEKGKPINETRVTDHRWRDKHLKALQQAYGWDASRLIYSSTYLLEVLIDPWRFLNAQFGKKTLTFRSSSLGWGPRDTWPKKSELILRLCLEVCATTYLSGPNGRDYLDLPSFEKAGIEVRWHDYPVMQPVLSAVHDLFSKEKVAA